MTAHLAPHESKPTTPRAPHPRQPHWRIHAHEHHPGSAPRGLRAGRTLQNGRRATRFAGDTIVAQQLVHAGSFSGFVHGVLTQRRTPRVDENPPLETCVRSSIGLGQKHTPPRSPSGLKPKRPPLPTCFDSPQPSGRLLASR